MKTGHSIQHSTEKTILFEEALNKTRLTIVGRLVPGLIHELNNQLQAVQGSMALALEGLENPDELIKFLQMGIEGSEKMSELINQIRLIYRPHTQPQQEIDLNRLLRQTDTWVGKELSSQNIHFRVVQDESSLFISDNSGDFQLVLLNLIFNLADAINAAGGGSILLSLRQSDREIVLSFITDPLIEPIDLSFEQEALVGCQGEINYFQEQQSVKISVPLANKCKSAEGEL